ncbi:MAG: hypothetical protein HKN68_18205 [Saprospiraceae bacterium]|nr:hypothetical protein [Saprospiraceae bacterium]
MKKALKPDEQDIWINKYLRDEMTEEERKDFEQQLEGDDALHQRVEAMKEIQAGIRQSVLNEKKEMMGEWDEELDEEGSSSIATDFAKASSVKSEDTVGSQRSAVKSEQENNVVEMKPKPNYNRWLLVWLSAAAVMVLVAVMVWPGEVKLSEEYAYLLDNEFETLIRHETKRSSEWIDPYTREQRVAYDLFQGQQFKQAIPKLVKLWEDERDSTAFGYLGYCYIFIGNEKKGESILNQIQ